MTEAQIGPVLSQKASEISLSVGTYLCSYKCDKLPMRNKKVSSRYDSPYKN